MEEALIGAGVWVMLLEALENFSDMVLESGGCVGESERHYMPFEGAVASPESHLPFVTLLDLEQMVGLPEVNFRIDFGLVWAVEEVGKVR